MKTKELLSIGLTPNKAGCYQSFPNKINDCYIMYQNGVLVVKSENKKKRIEGVTDLGELIYNIFY